MWFIPAALQLVTMDLMSSLLSSAVLAVVVTQTPRMALTSQTGEGGGVGVGVSQSVRPPPPDPDFVQPLQKHINIEVRSRQYVGILGNAIFICMNWGNKGLLN